MTRFGFARKEVLFGGLDNDVPSLLFETPDPPYPQNRKNLRNFGRDEMPNFWSAFGT